MQQLVGVSERVRLAIDDDSDLSLSEQHDVLVAMHADASKSDLLQHGRKLRFGLLVDRELDKGDALKLRRRGRVEKIDASPRARRFAAGRNIGFL